MWGTWKWMWQGAVAFHRFRFGGGWRAHFAGHKMQLARRWHVLDGSQKKLGNMVNPPCFDPFTGNCFDRFRFSVSFRFNVKLPDSEFVKIQYQPGQLAPGPDAWILDESDMRGRYINDRCTWVLSQGLVFPRAPFRFFCLISKNDRHH